MPVFWVAPVDGPRWLIHAWAVANARDILVTGSDSDIGRHAAMRLATPGRALVLAGRPEGTQQLEALALACRRNGATAHAVPFDLKRDPTLLYDEAIRRLTRLDGFVHCDPSLDSRTLLREPELATNLDERFATSLRSLVILATQITKGCAALHEPAAIVACAGQAGINGAMGHSLQGAMEGATLSFVRSAALEWRKHRVRINALISTALTQQTAGASVLKAAADDSLSAEHIAAVMDYLLAEECDFSGEWVGAAGNRMYFVDTRESVGVFSADNAPWTIAGLKHALDSGR